MTYSVNDDRRSDVIVVSSVMIAVSTLAVGLRCWGRYVARKTEFWWDDWLSILALPFVWAICGLSLYWVHLGLGQHIIDVHTPLAKQALVLFIMNFVYNTGLTLVKLSVLMVYARIFGTVRAYRIAFWITGFMIVAWCITMSFINLFGCIPVHKAWDSSVPGYCVSSKAYLFVGAILNILTDFILLLLPMPGLWHLQLSTRRKVGVTGVLMAGYLVLVLSILRFLFLARDDPTLGEDITYNGVALEILAVCELSVALISSCIPNIFNLVKHIAEKNSSHGADKSSNLKKGVSIFTIPLDAVKASIDRHRTARSKQLERKQKILEPIDERDPENSR